MSNLSPEIREKISLAKRKYATRPGGTCGIIIDTTPYRLKKLKNQFCSRECTIAWRKTRKGTLGANWKTGKITDKLGYILLYLPSHPYANNKGYVFEHRLVMEKQLNRYLTPDEIVHHIDFSRDNNAISNLVLTTREEHLVKYHRESLINRLPNKKARIVTSVN